VAWTGKCEADKVSMGRYDVAEGEGGMYGLVFDNTFSKTTGKTITFVLMTHPTNAPPKSGHHLHYSQAFAPNVPGGRKGSSPSLRPVTDSVESLHGDTVMHRGVLEDPRPRSNATESKGLEGSSFYTGVLHKKRRKKGQGHARRFFSLDFTSSTLSYYRDRHSSALRGAVPLSLAAIAVNEKAREFTVDSGAELWHLKASNRKDFDGWKNALERAAAAANIASTPTTPSPAYQGFVQAKQPDPSSKWSGHEPSSFLAKWLARAMLCAGLRKTQTRSTLLVQPGWVSVTPHQTPVALRPARPQTSLRTNTSKRFPTTGVKKSARSGGGRPAPRVPYVARA
jgi:hypothetical protein